MNRIIQQMVHTMLYETRTPHTFWGEAVHTIADILKKAHVWVNNNKNSYELWYGKRATVKHFRIFGRKCFIKKNDDKLGKFESRDNEGMLLGYTSRRKGYKCFNKRIQKLVECIDVAVAEASKEWSIRIMKWNENTKS